MAEGSTLAQKLDRLFELTKDRGGNMVRYEDLAERAAQHCGEPVSAGYIRHLRSGERDNPTFKVIHGLAHAFGVPVGYFFDDAVSAEIQRDLEFAQSLRAAGVTDIQARGLGNLTERGRAKVLAAIEEVTGEVSGAYVHPVNRLSGAQGKVLALVADGLTTPEIAERLNSAPSTINNHVAAILKTLDVATRHEAGAMWRARHSSGDAPAT